MIKHRRGVLRSSCASFLRWTVQGVHITHAFGSAPSARRLVCAHMLMLSHTRRPAADLSRAPVAKATLAATPGMKAVARPCANAGMPSPPQNAGPSQPQDASPFRPLRLDSGCSPLSSSTPPDEEPTPVGPDAWHGAVRKPLYGVMAVVQRRD